MAKETTRRRSSAQTPKKDAGRMEKGMKSQRKNDTRAQEAAKKARRRKRKEARRQEEQKIRQRRLQKKGTRTDHKLEDEYYAYYSGKKKHKPFTNTELSYFCGQMARDLQAGISSIEAIETMGEEYTSPADKAAMDRIRDDMLASGELSSSMEKSGLFPNYMVTMLSLGEKTGNVDSVMYSMQGHYAREEQLRTSIQSALFYPLIMTCMILAVIGVLLVKVMPIFNQVFRQLGTEMTGFAGVLMQLSNFINSNLVIILLVFAILVVIVIWCIKGRTGKKVSHWIMTRFRGYRELTEMIACCRIADGIALVQQSGYSPEQGFLHVCKLNEDKAFQGKLDFCQEKMDKGVSLADALKDSGIFVGSYAHMITNGSRTGSLDKVMTRIAEIYQDEIDTKISNQLAMLEPALIVILSMIVGAILISVMFPLLGIMATL